jgi:hypothetical protein
LVDIFPTLAEVAGLTLAPPLLMAAAGATAEATGAGSLNGHEEPPLDGLSLLPLLLASAKDANGGAPARCAKSIGRGVAVAVQEKEETRKRKKDIEWLEESVRRSALGRPFAVTQFPRCPIRYNRVGERRSLVQEPWRTCGAGGFECQGRIVRGGR